jgi:hypothetical protein
LGEPVYVITTARRAPMYQLTHPLALTTVRDAHRCRAAQIDPPLGRWAYGLYALLSVLAVAAAYGAAWVLTTPLRLVAALAVGLALVLL